MNKKLIKLIKIIVTLLILLCIWFFFVKINQSNYEVLKKIKYNTVNHPEILPSKEYAKQLSFWFENIRSDILWLETIQYIWWNAISSEYKKYLFVMLDLITELSPDFFHPYKIWMLLLPDTNERYEDLTKNEENKYVRQAEELWLKWMKQFCDLDKIELIKNEEDLNKIWSEDKFKNPCQTYEIPFHLAYVYYFHLKDPKTASDYYKIASAHDDAVEWAKILAAIMKWKGWDREKAFLMFLNIWKTLDNSEEQICKQYISVVEKFGFGIFRENKLNAEIVKTLNQSREKVFWKFDPDSSKGVSLDWDCPNYVNKSIREVNLHYIEEANEKYKIDNDWKNSLHAKELFDKKYIEYLPIDYQQYEDYGIVYRFDKEVWNYDYWMWAYE